MVISHGYQNAMAMDAICSPSFTEGRGKKETHVAFIKRNHISSHEVSLKEIEWCKQEKINKARSCEENKWANCCQETIWNK